MMFQHLPKVTALIILLSTSLIVTSFRVSQSSFFSRYISHRIAGSPSNRINPFQTLQFSLLERQLFAQTLNLNQQRKRIALVIGNADYEVFGKLNNPVNDANDMAAVLKELNFEVILIKDADLRTMEESLYRFEQKLKKDRGVGLFYFAGHGVQVEGENYLVPLNSGIKREQDFRYDALQLGKVIGALENAGNDANIIILDACRNNEFSGQWEFSGKGLAPVQSGKGLFIAYATEPGGEALDGEQQDNGLYTSSLLKYLKTPNLSLAELFDRVREDVYQKSDEFQLPWTASSFIGSFIFNPTPPTETIATSTPTPQLSPSPQPLPTPQPSPSPIQRSLISRATQVDYSPLNELLKQGKWQEADIETFYLMLTASNRENYGYLDRPSLANFACSDLEIIDYLWREYSQGKFGFSVQQNLWEKMGGNLNSPDNMWRSFAIEVGWKQGSEDNSEGYLNYDDLNFKTDAPQGHLPVLGEGSSFIIRGWGKDIFALINKCAK